MSHPATSSSGGNGADRFDDRALLRPVERETIQMIDGAEKIPWIVHAVLTVTTPRLIVTAHGRREGLPILFECAVSPSLIEELVIELAGRTPHASRARGRFSSRSAETPARFSPPSTTYSRRSCFATTCREPFATAQIRTFPVSQPNQHLRATCRTLTVSPHASR